MAKDPIVFAMANPDPEIRPEEADGLAKVIATGRSDYPNQINNVLAFPGIFRGALDVSATRITEGMKLAAAAAIAEVVGDEVRPDYIVPSVFDHPGGPARGRAGGRGGRGRRRLPHRHHLSRFPTPLPRTRGRRSTWSRSPTTRERSTQLNPRLPVSTRRWGPAEFSPLDLRMRRLLRLPADARRPRASARRSSRCRSTSRPPAAC